MKIIKIVQELEDIDSEKNLCSVNSFNLEEFLKQKKQYIDESAYSIFQTVGIGLTTENVSSQICLLTIKSYLEKTLEDIALSLLRNIYDQSKKIEILDLKEAQLKYPKSYGLTTGTYTVHPCSSEMLTPIESFHSKLAMEKDDELIVLLGKLGAKTVRITESDIQQKTTDGNVKLDSIVANVEGNLKLSNKITKGKELLVCFQEDYKDDFDPNLLINSLWFKNDSQLMSIYHCRNPSSRHKMTEYTIRSTYTETFDFDFDLASKYLTFKVDLEGEYCSLREKERLFEVSFFAD